MEPLLEDLGVALLEAIAIANICPARVVDSIDTAFQILHEDGLEKHQKVWNAISKWGGGGRREGRGVNPRTSLPLEFINAAPGVAIICLTVA